MNASSERANAAIVVFVCLCASIVMGLLSDGAHHDDDLTHFLVARWSWWFPSYLVQVWGRPGLTLPLALVSWLPNVSMAWHAARILSALATAIGALIAANVAQRLGVRRLWWIVVACYAQPLCAVLSYTTLTENFTALYLVAAVALYWRGRYLTASAIFSLALVSRYETVVLLLIWGVALLACNAKTNRKASAIALSLWAPVVHNILHRCAFGTWPAMTFLQPHGSTQYVATGWSGYFPQTLLALSPAIAALAVVGAFVLWQRGTWLVPSLAGAFFLTHVAICARGVYASGGFGRFMVTVGPFIAILAVVGAEEMLRGIYNPRYQKRAFFISVFAWAVFLAAIMNEIRSLRLLPIPPYTTIIYGIIGVIILLSAILALARHSRILRRVFLSLSIVLGLAWAAQFWIVVHPLHCSIETTLALQAAQHLVHDNLSHQPIFATNPWVSYKFDLIENPRAHKDDALLASMPVGTIFIWDSVYSPSDFHQMTLRDYEDNPSYRKLYEYNDKYCSLTGTISAPRVVVMQKIAPTSEPVVEKKYYPPPLTQGEPVRGVFYVRPSVPTK